MGVGWLQPQTIRDVFGGKGKNVKEHLSPSESWHHWLFGREFGRTEMPGKARSIHDFKLYFLITLYSWSVVLNHATKFTFWDVVNIIIVESLRAWYYFVKSILVYMGDGPLVSFQNNFRLFIRGKEKYEVHKEASI